MSDTTVEEIAPDVYRIATIDPTIGRDGFGFNQFLVAGDEPFLFHCGMRSLFEPVRDAVDRVVPADTVRWVSFGHVEADEMGALGPWLDRSPHAQAVHSTVACRISVADLSPRPPRGMDDGDVVDLGRHRLRLLVRPHLPHNWDTIMWFDETTATLFCGHLGANLVNGRPTISNGLADAAMATERLFPGGTARTPQLVPAIRGLAELRPDTLAIMHGASVSGDGRRALLDLADAYGR